MAHDAHQLLRDGDLDGARSALVEVVRSAPSDQAARMFLFQLLAVAGEWDKAKKQLALLAQLSPEAQMLSVAYGQAIDAELERASIFAGKAPMPVLVASPWLEKLAEAVGHFAAGRTPEGEAAREDAFERAPDTPGTLDGESFDWIADADGRFGPSFEAIVNGRYGLIGFDAVEKIVSKGPQDLRDLIWYPVEIAMRSGQSVAAMLPARYPGSEASASVDERLARATGWTDAAEGQRGSGQHLWATSSGDDHALLSVRSLTFD
ncbi:MAG TPA: type VI secretion system accessory protein TagJ [Sphingomonas sp.]|jgi:type VI secretion system protein ImpE